MPTFEELSKELFDGPRDASRSFARQQIVSQVLKLGDPRVREGLVALLRDPDRALRIQAIESLRPFKDEKVIFAVTQALRDRDAEVRRVAAKWLGEDGDEACVHALEALGDDESWFVQHEAASAMERIRARAREAKAAADAREIPVAKLDPEAPPAAPPVVKGRPSNDDILRHVASRLCAAARRTKTGASFTVQIGDARKQTVQVMFQKSGAPPREYVVFYTECGPAEPARFGDALRKNFRMHFGSIAIQDKDGKPSFVLFDVIPRDVITPDLAAEVAKKVARHGDDFEQALGGTDVH